MHASLIVALDGRPKDIEAAVAFQMEPFDENGVWFADGSRWDWWQIGGRWTGLLSSYDPEADEKNYEPCKYCGATGKRAEPPLVGPGTVHCNGCKGTGRAFKWPTEWAHHTGDTVLKRDLDLVGLKAARVASLTRTFEESQREKPGAPIELLYGVKPNETLDQFLARRVQGDGFPAAAVFLRNRNWHEHERQGWFGPVATECQQQGNDTHICLFEKDGARVISWNGTESWDEMYYKRFIEPLPDDTTLVVVDYHV